MCIIIKLREENFMFKKILCIVMAVAMALALLTACAAQGGSGSTTVKQQDSTTAKTTAAKTTEEKKEPVVINMLAQNPEYEAQTKEIWSIYTKENPNVTVNVTSVNDAGAEGFLAKVAAGDAPDITGQALPNTDKTNYKTFVNLLDIGYPYWDQLSIDYKNEFDGQLGIKDYVPAMNLFGRVFSFIYHKDEMAKAGLDPSTIRTMDDLDNFLAELKIYVDKTDGIKYVLDL
jgi:ABC-type glycerol-3-phosphate transport system substrate-binding protein